MTLIQIHRYCPNSTDARTRSYAKFFVIGEKSNDYCFLSFHSLPVSRESIHVFCFGKESR